MSKSGDSLENSGKGSFSALGRGKLNKVQEMTPLPSIHV